MKNDISHSKINGNDVFKIDTPEKHTGYLIWQISNIRQRIINKDLQELDLTYPQFAVLSGIQWLKRDNETVNQVNLIHFGKMDKSVVSSVLKSLEKRNIVIREVDPKDTRAKNLALSALGSSKLEKALILIKKIDEVFFNENKFDIECFNNILLKLIKENG